MMRLDAERSATVKTDGPKQRTFPETLCARAILQQGGRSEAYDATVGEWIEERPNMRTRLRREVSSSS